MTAAAARPHEDWRRFEPRRLDMVAAGPRGPVPALDDLWIDAPGPRLLFVDGVFRADASAPGEVVVEPARAGDPGNPYAARAGDEAESGWSLRLGADAAASGLVQIVHATTGGTAHLANRIVLDRDAQASLVETQVGAGWANAATVIDLADGARLMRATRVLKQGGALTETVTGNGVGGASYVSVALVAGTETARLTNRLTAGEGCYVETSGAVLARAEQSADIFNSVRHDGENGTSRQIWRAVADDRATASLAARVEVARGAQKTDGEQSLRGLLMARTATVNLKPELEIFADDVKCAHGATVGELDRQALFYLASRGIPPAPARALLTRAFVADALSRIGDEAVRDAFVADADRWLS